MTTKAQSVTVNIIGAFLAIGAGINSVLSGEMFGVALGVCSMITGFAIIVTTIYMHAVDK